MSDPAPPAPKDTWQCLECGDIYGPEDAEDGDLPPICSMCLKAMPDVAIPLPDRGTVGYLSAGDAAVLGRVLDDSEE